MATREECIAFLREQLACAEQRARTREDMARPVRLSPGEWEEAMNLHPSTRGTPMPTIAEQEAEEALQARIAARYRREAELYRAAIDRLTQRRVEPPGATCRVCLDGTVVTDTCDDCGERHCPSCMTCATPDAPEAGR
ncbi:MAG: hypothetical protein KIT14_22590 [bacterium]|nr:hypothetical protein [bacterium]